jgi:hypothetical protein
MWGEEKMKWKAKNGKEKVGKTEHCIEFALFPVLCVDNYYRWLENVEVEKTYWWGHFSGCLLCDEKYYPINGAEKKMTMLKLTVIGFLGLFVIAILVILSLPFIPFIGAYRVGKFIVEIYNENRAFNKFRQYTKRSS